MLGTREPSTYGNQTLADINSSISELAKLLEVQVSFFQSNIEGLIVEEIHKSKDTYNAIIINPAAYTHTSIAIRDALLAVDVPFVEVHLSNVYKREQFRHKSYMSDISVGQITGFGKGSYLLALRGIVDYLR